MRIIFVRDRVVNDWSGFTFPCGYVEDNEIIENL